MTARFTPGPYDFPNGVCRILMLGKSGTGKSSTGNTLLGREKFKIACAFTEKTEECHRESAKFYNTTLEVIDTPGLFAPSQEKQWAVDIIAEGLASLEHGPNIILFTISCKTRFTEEDKRAFEVIKELMGPKVSEYMIVVFTAAEELDMTIAQCLAVKSKSDPEEKSMVAEVVKCAGARHVTFNNKLPLNSEERDMQVNKFLETALKMVSVNNPEYFCYTMSEKLTEIVSKSASEECAKSDNSDKMVIDMPDLVSMDLEYNSDRKSREVLSRWRCDPLDAALLVIRCDERYTSGQYEIYLKMREKLGDLISPDNLIVVFTHGKSFQEDVVRHASGELQRVLQDAGHRYVVLDNSASDGDKETNVCRLLTMVDRFRDPSAPDRKPDNRDWYTWILWPYRFAQDVWTRVLSYIRESGESRNRPQNNQPRSSFSSHRLN